MENSNENKVEVIRAKAKDFMEIVKQKAPIYWGVVRTKTISTWNSGTKGKAICIGVAVMVLLLGCLVLGGKPKNEKVAEAIAKSQVDTARIMAETQAKADGARKQLEEQEAKRIAERDQQIAEEKKLAEAQRHKEEERIRQRVENERRQEEERKKAQEEQRQNVAEEEKAAEEKQAEEYAADSDLRAREILSGVGLWGQSIYFQPEKKVSYEEFAKTFYTIEDAFIPKFGMILVKLHSGQGIFPAGVSQMIVKELVPRADHLLFYCCRTGLKADAPSKDKINYVKLLNMAQMEKNVLSAYALAFGQDSKQLLSEAERMFEVFTKVRKSLPPHEPAADAEERYATLPYPARPIDLNDAAAEVDHNACAFEMEYYERRPKFADGTDCYPNKKLYWSPVKDGQSQKTLVGWTISHESEVTKKWLPIDIGNFPIKSFCGMEFGQTLAACEKNLGDVVWHDYNDFLGLHAYRLKKPFRQFTRACLRFGFNEGERDSNTGTTTRTAEFQGLRSIQLEADIPGDVNYESCLEELVKVKKLLEGKYKIDLGKGQVGESYLGQSYWYGVGLSETGWVVLGIRTATDGQNNRVKDGRKTMVLEVRYSNWETMRDLANASRENLDAKRAAEAESKKKKLNVSDDAGADVL